MNTMFASKKKDLPLKSRGDIVKLAENLKSMKCVEMIGNFESGATNSFNFIFFLCPKLNGNGYQLNENLTGFTVKYGKGLRKSSFDRVQKVKNFLRESEELGILCNVKGIMADEEAFTLFPIPVAPPEIFSGVDGIPIISTYELIKADFSRFGELFRNKPWMAVPNKFRDMGFSHLSNILGHTHAPENLIQDFIERVFAENALEGLWTKEGKFGENPVFLGVEGPEIPILQNAALEKKDWIPYVQLK